MKTTLTIEKLVFGGQGFGRTDEGKAAFIWNALPGETVEVEILENKKNSLIDSLPGPTEEIINTKIKKIEQKMEKEVDNALKKIQTAIEEILSIDNPKTGKII